MAATSGDAGASSRLHLGLTPWREDWDGTAGSLARQGEVAEELGYDSLWLPESHFTGKTANPAPLLRLAAVAARTERLGIGTTSFLLPVRHPIHAAEEVAVLDRLSGGRLILGVGRGFRGALFAAFDVPVSEKRDRFGAALDAMQRAWRGEPVAFEEPDGEGAEPTPVCVSPLPLQQPHPPIWVAAFGPKAVTQAGRLGLPYLASPIEPMAALEANYARHRAALPSDTGADTLSVPIMRTVFASESRATVRAVREALEKQAAALGRGSLKSLRRVAEHPLEAWALVGAPAEIAEGVARYRETLGMSHLIVRGHVPGASTEALETSLHLLAALER